jgi:hypothetical protein
MFKVRKINNDLLHMFGKKNKLAKWKSSLESKHNVVNKKKKWQHLQ